MRDDPKFSNLNASKDFYVGRDSRINSWKMSETAPSSNIDKELETRLKAVEAENAVLREALFLLADDETGPCLQFMSAPMLRMISQVLSTYGRDTEKHNRVLQLAKGEYNRMFAQYPDQSGPAARDMSRVEHNTLIIQEQEKAQSEQLRKNYPELHAAALRHVGNTSSLTADPDYMQGRRRMEILRRRQELARSRREYNAIQNEKDEIAEARDKALERIGADLDSMIRTYSSIDEKFLEIRAKRPRREVLRADLAERNDRQTQMSVSYEQVE
jgi:hypothetical protein